MLSILSKEVCEGATQLWKHEVQSIEKACPTPQKKQRSKALGINGTHPWIFLLEFLWVNLHAVGFPGGLPGKKSVCNAGDLGQSLGREDPLEKGKATHSSILVWRIPWTEEPGRL